MPKVAAPDCSAAFSGAARTPRVEKKLAKSTVGPAIPAFAPPTHSTCATFLPARSAAAARVSAWSVPGVEKLVRLLKLPSPVRWYVLFVEPCSDGHVPVVRVYQPTPVFGGKPCSMPLAPRTPSAISCLYVGIWPWAAYCSMRSGRMPSEAKKIALEALVAGGAAMAVGAKDVSRATTASTTGSRKRTARATGHLHDLVGVRSGASVTDLRCGPSSWPHRAVQVTNDSARRSSR